MNNDKVNNSKTTNTRTIEVYVGYVNHTWTTQELSVPDSYSDADLEDRINELFWEHGNYEDDGEIAFVGVYYIPSNEEI